MNITIQTFGHPETVIKEYEHWFVLFRMDQITAGSLVLAAKSDATHLGELTSEEWAEFSQVSKDVEAVLCSTFGAEKFNYLALMMKDPNVHFHFVPRYSKPVEVNGREYTDADWPLKTELNTTVMPKEDSKTIQAKLTEAFGEL